jgi:hypothetical protein
MAKTAHCFPRDCIGLQLVSSRTDSALYPYYYYSPDGWPAALEACPAVKLIDAIGECCGLPLGLMQNQIDCMSIKHHQAGLTTVQTYGSGL